MGFENPFRNKNKKEIAAAAGLAAAGLAGAALDAQGLADGSRLGREMHDARTKIEMKLEPTDIKSMQEKGPGGATMSIDPESGQTIVNIPAPEGNVVNMRPPGEGKAVTVDLSSRIVDMAPPGAEGGSKSIDLSEKVKSVDLSEKTVTMKPPTDPEMMRKSEQLPNGGY